MRRFTMRPMRSPRAFSLRVSPSLGLALAAVAFLGSCASASAWEVHGTQYTLEVVEGETTLPEYQVAHISGAVQPSAPVAVAIIHGGTTTYKTGEGNGSAWGDEVPQPGDTVVLESPVGHTVASEVYDGMPTIDPSTCVGSTSFEGDNTAGFTVEGWYAINTLEHPYHRSPERKESDFQLAQVKTLTGTSFGGSFLQPIPAGATVTAKESLKSQLASETTFVYESERVEPANETCPVPPAPVSPPPPLVTPLRGALVNLHRATILGLLKSGWSDHVSINQAGTITQDLYLRGGRLPASAASARKHHRSTPTDMLLARGTAKASAAGTVGVLLKLTSAGRRKLHGAKHLNAILLTTLRTANGQVDTLSPHSLTLVR
jgi:hypothetical protein